MADHISGWAQFCAEYRVLPLRRFIKDQAYWRWVLFWFWALDPLTAMQRIPYVAGCLGYFEWRDQFEYPALKRWAAYRWQLHRSRMRAGAD